MKISGVTFAVFLCSVFQLTCTGIGSAPSDNMKEEPPTLPNRIKRIVNGLEAPPTRFPYHVAIMVLPKVFGSLHYLCGGAILAPNWVLTAAHCIADLEHSVVVLAGTSELDSSLGIFDYGKQFKIVTRAQIHPGYNDSTTENDLAVLWLQSGLDMTPGLVEPVPVFNGTQGRGQVLVSGWGSTSTADSSPSRRSLRYTSLELFSPRFCAHLLRTSFVEVEYDPATMLCVMGDGAGTCYGDSGSPVVNSDGSLVGIVSFGTGANGTCFIDSPSYDVRVSAYIDWIQEVCQNCLTFPSQADPEVLASFEPPSQSQTQHHWDYAFQVLITRREPEPSLERSCTGSIIARRWILTSTACIDDTEEVSKATLYIRPATIALGEDDLAPVVLVDKGWVFEVEGELDHSHGAALLHTVTDFTWIGWKRVQLGLQEDLASEDTAELASWAEDPRDASRLYYRPFNVSLFSDPFCTGLLSPSIFDPRTMICAMEDKGTETDSEGTSDFRYCEDHFGVPVMQNGLQIGMVNGYVKRESGDCFSDFPMIITRISAYIDWIQEVCHNCLNDTTDDDVDVVNESASFTCTVWQQLVIVQLLIVRTFLV